MQKMKLVVALLFILGGLYLIVLGMIHILGAPDELFHLEILGALKSLVVGFALYVPGFLIMLAGSVITIRYYDRNGVEFVIPYWVLQTWSFLTRMASWIESQYQVTESKIGKLVAKFNRFVDRYVWGRRNAFKWLGTAVCLILLGISSTAVPIISSFLFSAALLLVSVYAYTILIRLYLRYK